MDRLERALQGSVDDLTTELQRAQDLSAQADVDRKRAAADRDTARREARTRATRTPNPVGAGETGTPVENIERESRAARQARADLAKLNAEEERRGRNLRNLTNLEEQAAAVQRARNAEYLQQRVGGEQSARPTPATTRAGDATEMVRAAAIERAAVDQAARDAAERAAQQARNNQYPAPIGPQRAPGFQVAQVQQAAVAAQKLAEDESLLVQRALATGDATQRVNGLFAEQARALGLADDAYTRHGYLTSEFIAAAARGQVTFSQLGTQVGGTIAKFAGWTAAATAVYAAVGAMHELYQGSIQAASGVGLVNRVTTKELPGGAQELQQRFRDLSQQFNLPIEDVVQGVYGSAKATGGDLPAALEVTKQALFGVKVGELSAADSTRYLQAIMRGFGADAAELPAIFDAINQAQNRFGGSTGDMIAGVAKAAGIFKLAGGDYRELIALITTGSKLTGASGQEVATAISRSASRVLTPQGADALRAQDLDPTRPFTEILAEASRKAQGASPEQVNLLARALVPQGGQYARILAPILQNRELYQNVFSELAPEKAQGSAARELANALKQPNEQLKALLIDLQSLGAALAQAGGLNLLVGVTKGLDTALDLVTKFLDTWNAITPAPIRGLLTPLLEVAAILKVLRRLDVGASLPQGRGGTAYEQFRTGLSRPPDQRYNAEVLKGTEDESKRIDEMRRRAAIAASDSAFEVERSAARQAQALQGHAATPSTDVEARALSQARVERAQAEFETRLLNHERLIQNEADLTARAAAIQAQINAYTAARNAGLTSQAAALQAGIVTKPPTLERPVAASPERISGAPVATSPVAAASEAAAVGLGVAAGSADTERIVEEAARAQEELARGIEGTTAAVETMHEALSVTDIREQLVEPLKDAGAEAAKNKREGARAQPAAGREPTTGPRFGGTTPPPRTTPDGTTPIGTPAIGRGVPPGAEGAVRTARLASEAQAMDRKLAEFAKVNGRLSAASALIGRSAGAASGVVKTAGYGLQAAGRGLSALAASLGPLDLAVIGVMVGIQAYGDYKRSGEENANALERLRSRAGGPEAIRARVEEERRKTAAAASARQSPGNFLDKITHPGRTYRNYRDSVGALANTVLPGDPISNHFQQQADEAQKALKDADVLEEAQKHKRLLYLAQIRTNFKRSSAAATSTGDLEAALQEGIQEVANSYTAKNRPNDAEGKAKLEEFVDEMRARIASIKAARGDLEAAAEQVENLKTNASFIGQIQTSFGLQGLTPTNLGAASVGIANARRLISTPGVAPADAAEALQQIEALQSDVQQQVDAWLSRLLPYATPHEAAGLRAQAVAKLRAGLNTSLTEQLGSLQGQIAGIDERIAAVPQSAAFGPLASPTAGLVTGQAADPTAALQKKKNQLLARVKGINEQLGRNGEKITAFDRQNQREQFASGQQLYDARTGLQASRVVDPVARIRLQLRRVNARLRAIAKEYGRESVEYANALQQARDLRDQEIAAVLNGIQLGGELAAAKDPSNAAAIKSAHDSTGMRYLESKGQKDSDAYKQLQIDSYQAAQQQQSDAISLFQAQQEANRSAANIGASQGAQLSGAAADASAFLAFVRSHGGDKAQILGATTALNQARGALADYARQQAQALVQAKGEMEKSLTEDPVKQAEIDLRTAQAQVQFAQTPAERTSALAAVNNARRSARNTSQQEKFNNIEFDASIEKIDAATEISRLQSLANAMHGNRDLKRQIRKRIFDLKKGTDDSFANLEIGDIKLPTLYDVRRMARSGTKGVSVHNDNNIVLQIDRAVDMNEVGAALERITGGSVSGAMRSAGVI